MQIDYVGRNYHPDEEVRRHVEDKLRKVVKFLAEPVEVRVTLEVEKHRHIAELHVAHRFGVLQATEETADMQDAINQAVDKMEKQARRSRQRFVDRRRRADRSQNGQHWPVAIVDRESVGGGGAPRVIESTALSIKPMTIEEAALQLEDSEAGFVVFRDAVTDRLSVLYKRRDDNYGLVSPEL